jgi:hypothetical protein
MKNTYARSVLYHKIKFNKMMQTVQLNETNKQLIQLMNRIKIGNELAGIELRFLERDGSSLFQILTVDNKSNRQQHNSKDFRGYYYGLPHVHDERLFMYGCTNNKISPFHNLFYVQAEDMKINRMLICKDQTHYLELNNFMMNDHEREVSYDSNLTSTFLPGSLLVVETVKGNWIHFGMHTSPGVGIMFPITNQPPNMKWVEEKMEYFAQEFELNREKRRQNMDTSNASIPMVTKSNCPSNVYQCSVLTCRKNNLNDNGGMYMFDALLSKSMKSITIFSPFWLPIFMEYTLQGQLYNTNKVLVVNALYALNSIPFNMLTAKIAFPELKTMDTECNPIDYDDIYLPRTHLPEKIPVEFAQDQYKLMNTFREFGLVVLQYDFSEKILTRDVNEAQQRFKYLTQCAIKEQILIQDDDGNRSPLLWFVRKYTDLQKDIVDELLPSILSNRTRCLPPSSSIPLLSFVLENNIILKQLQMAYDTIHDSQKQKKKIADELLSVLKQVYNYNNSNINGVLFVDADSITLNMLVNVLLKTTATTMHDVVCVNVKTMKYKEPPPEFEQVSIPIVLVLTECECVDYEVIHDILQTYKHHSVAVVLIGDWLNTSSCSDFKLLVSEKFPARFFLSTFQTTIIQIPRLYPKPILLGLRKWQKSDNKQLYCCFSDIGAIANVIPLDYSSLFIVQNRDNVQVTSDTIRKVLDEKHQRAKHFCKTTYVQPHLVVSTIGADSNIIGRILDLNERNTDITSTYLHKRKHKRQRRHQTVPVQGKTFELTYTLPPRDDEDPQDDEEEPPTTTKRVKGFKKNEETTTLPFQVCVMEDVQQLISSIHKTDVIVVMSDINNPTSCASTLRFAYSKCIYAVIVVGMDEEMVTRIMYSDDDTISIGGRSSKEEAIIALTERQKWTSWTTRPYQSCSFNVMDDRLHFNSLPKTKCVTEEYLTDLQRKYPKKYVIKPYLHFDIQNYQNWDNSGKFDDLFHINHDELLEDEFDLRNS